MSGCEPLREESDHLKVLRSGGVVHLEASCESLSVAMGEGMSEVR